MKQLKSLSLDSNVLATQSQAATAAQTFSLVKKQLDTVQAEAAAQLIRANDLAQKALAEHNATAAFYSTKSDPFDEATDNLKALQGALHMIDEMTEGLIAVTVVGSPDSPALKATY